MHGVQSLQDIGSWTAEDGGFGTAATVDEED
jgi:hypothetical protein